jgi:hypothetical protein
MQMEKSEKIFQLKIHVWAGDYFGDWTARITA